MIKVKAVNIWPQALDGVLFSYPEIQEYNAKVIVDEKGREAVHVIVEFKNEVGEQRIDELLPLVASHLKQTTGIHMETFKAKPGEIEHFDFKPKRLKDARQQSLAGYRR